MSTELCEGETVGMDVEKYKERLEKVLGPSFLASVKSLKKDVDAMKAAASEPVKKPARETIWSK
jgi:hypothetical protein